MPQTADAVIVGGGVMGCSILYNLAKRGMARCLLLEQEVLGSPMPSGRFDRFARGDLLSSRYRYRVLA